MSTFYDRLAVQLGMGRRALIWDRRGAGSRWALWVGVFFWAASVGVQGQWVSQTLRLQPGFNPVFLQVTPADPSINTLFGGVPEIREVWMYNRYVQTTTFVTDPTRDPAGQDHWLTWYPTGSPKAFLATLSQMRGGQSYLIKVATNSAPITVTVRGIPMPPRSDWIPDDVILAGFPIQETGKITFFQFLKDSPQVLASPGRESQLFTVNPATAFETQIRNPEATTIVPGRAYWAFIKGHAHNPYPFEARTDGENGAVQFARDRLLSSITLKNNLGSADAVLQVRMVESESPPVGMPEKAGSAPLAAFLPQADGGYRMVDLRTRTDIALRAGEARTIRLGLMLRDLAPSTNTNATYQAFLEVTEKVHGYRQLVPVVAEVSGSRLLNRTGSLMGTAGRTNRAAAPAADSGVAVAQSAGLWMGTLTLNAVNNPAFGSPDGGAPTTPATPLDMRVLVHVDGTGVARLVQQVLFADVSDGTNRVTRMYSSLSNFPPGAVLRSRISAPAWPAAAPSPLSGAFGGTLSGTVTVPHNDRVNPFVHTYHPDHNNLAEDFKTSLPTGRESFTVVRNVGFYFGVTSLSGTAYSPMIPPMKFRGQPSEYVRSGPFSNTVAFSVQLWLNVPSLQQNGATVLLLTNSTTQAQARLSFVANTGALAFTVQNAAVTGAQVQSDIPIPVGSWVHVAATYDGTSASLFINGNPVGSEYLPTLASGSWDAAWVGNTSAGGSVSLLGSVHDVVVRSGSLSQQVVPQLMAVPQLLNPGSIVLELQGSAVSTNVINAGSAPVTVSVSTPAVVDVATVPSVPLWTHGRTQGFYQESVSGLRKQTITIQGVFQMTRVSPDADLY